MNGNYYNTNGLYQPPTRQSNLNMINDEIHRLEQMRNQITQQANQQNPPAINQTFQLAPNTPSMMKFANTIEDVTKEFVAYETPFFSRDMSVLWIKNNKNEIRTYELKEIVPKDDKDLQIEFLTSRLEELERKMKNESISTNVIPTEDATDTTGDDEPIGKSIENEKSTSVSKVSRSKATK